MKNKRHAKIIDIITQYNIETQDELIEKLRECGFDITQATVSRDIKELKLIKTTSDDNRYKYAMSVQDDLKISEKYRKLIAECVLSVDYAGNLTVVKTYAGMAQAAAAAIDGMKWETTGEGIDASDLVGTIAGDDTVLLVMRDESKSVEISSRIKKICEI